MNHLADAFDKPSDSRDHCLLKEELWLGGPSIQCRYYLGMLLGRNEFRRTSDEFLNDLTEYITAQTSTVAAMFCCTESHCQIVVDFLQRSFELQQGERPSKKQTKEHRAVEVLLKHPDWSDEQIAEEVGATLKTLKRWATYGYARRCQKLYEEHVEGWHFPPNN